MGVGFLSGVVGFDTTSPTTNSSAALGDTEWGLDGNQYIYVRAAEAITAFSLCLISDTGAGTITMTTGGASTVPRQYCVPQVAFANAEYGWAVRMGRSFTIRTGAAAAAGAKLYTHATPGTVDDVSASQTLIQGLQLTVLAGSATTTTASASIPLCSAAET